jgi:hypothetical protein
MGGMILDPRLHDGAERPADDDADGHVHDVALEGELPELVEYAYRDLLSAP